MGNLRDFHHGHLLLSLHSTSVSFGLELVIMSHVLLWLFLVVTLSLHTCEGNSQGYNKDTNEKKLKSTGGMTVSELVEQSSCQARETLIEVHDEFPDEIQYNILPRCVPVQRCLGCCINEAMTCIPEKTETVNLAVRRIYSDRTSETIVLPFVKHTHCTCRSRRHNKN